MINDQSMKKIYLTLALLALLAQTTDAQNEKRLMKMSTASGDSQTFEYNKDGKLGKVQTILRDEGSKENHVNTFTYTTDKIIQNHYENNSSEADTRIATLENGMVKSELLTFSYTEGALHPYTYKYTYTYNDLKQLTEILEEPSMSSSTAYKLAWSDGDITLITCYRENEPVGEVHLDYDKTIDNPYFVLVLNPLTMILDMENVMPFGQVLGGYFGTVFRHPIKSVHYTVLKKDRFSWSAEDDIEFTYTKNADGDITEVTATEQETDKITLEWSKVTNGIATTRQATNAANACYTISGMRQKAPVKGLNIIKEPDGTVKKVIIR